MPKLVSFIMCVHNEKEEYLKVAINSMIQQDYSNTEIIIIDDASTQECSETIDSLCTGHENIRVFKNISNLGLTKSLNLGLEYACGEYIARMDADDYSVKDRISKQVEFLEKNQDVDVVGTGVVTFGEYISYMSPFIGMNSEEAAVSLFFTSTLCHPSVMLRKEFLEKHSLQYDPNVKKGQDFDLWERCSEFGKIAVMKEVLLYYRVHPLQITSQNKNEQNSSAERTMIRRLSRLGLFPNKEEFECHLALRGEPSANPKSIEALEKWGQKLIDASKNSKLVSSSMLEQEIRKRVLLYKLRNKMFKRFKSNEVVLLSKLFVDRLSYKIHLFTNRQILKHLNETRECI